jgi:LuxR family maltose regulon positive regulatory protein
MLQGTVELSAAETAYYKNDLKNAETLASQAAEKARGQEQFQVENRALFFLLRLGIHKGDGDAVRDVLRQLEKQVENKEFLNGYTLYDIVTGWFFAQIGKRDQIAHWLKSDLEKSELNSLMYGMENMVKAKFHMAEKRYPLVLAFLENRENINGLEDFLLGKLELKVMQGVCLYHVGQKDQSVRALEEAYEISISEGLDMPFIEMGKDMRVLAGMALKIPGCAIPKPWLEKLRRQSSAYAKKLALVAESVGSFEKGNVIQIAKLSRREGEVLRDLAQGFTREEIAATCYISINTVKGIIKNIYSKLGAVNRADAVRIATAWGLLRE